MKTKIYGASDDLVEIDGAISEEANPPYNALSNIEASDGTKGTITYGSDGNWIINVTKEGSLFDKIVKAVGDENKHTDVDAIGYSSYSDVLVLKEGIEWVKVGKRKFK